MILQCTHLKSFSLTSFEGLDLKYIEQLAANLPQIEEVEFISKFIENPKQISALSASLIFMKKCDRLRKATSTIQIEKSDAKYKRNKWFYTKSNEIVDSFQEQMKNGLIFNWWRWAIKHEVKIVDFLKGWQSGPCLSATMTKANII